MPGSIPLRLQRSIDATNARATGTQQEMPENVDILWISRPPYPLKYNKTTNATPHHRCQDSLSVVPKEVLQNVISA
jgi:hypothetical protein